MCLVHVIQSVTQCYESLVQVIPINIVLRGSIAGAIVYCDVYRPRHMQKRPVIRMYPLC